MPQHPDRTARAFLLLFASCLGACNASEPTADPADQTEVETVNPQGLAWIAPVGRNEVAQGEPLYLSVYTGNAAVQTIHFTVDGAEVGVCYRPRTPTVTPDTTPDDDPGATESAAADTDVTAEPPDPDDPTNVYPLAPELDNGEEPEDDGDPTLNTASNPDVDDDDVVEDEVADEEVTSETDPGEGNDCLVDNAGSWTTTLDTLGPHTVGAWFETPDGRRVETTRRVNVVSTPPTESTDEGPDTPVGQPFDDPGATRSPIDTVVDAVVESNDPRSLPFHRAFPGGREWAVSNHTVVFHHGQLMGSVRTITRCMNLWASSFTRYAPNASIASLVANAYAQAGCSREGRPGLSGISGSECVALAHMTDDATHRRACLERLNDSGDFAIELASRKIARLRREHHGDPPLIAATLRAGAVRRSSARPWAMRGGQAFITRFVQGYNAYWAWQRNPRRRPNEPHDRHVPACDHAAGDHAGADIEFPASGGTLAGLRSRIQHVILITQENHSFDAMFGHTPRAHSDRMPRGWTNRGRNGDVVHPFHLRTACPLDPRHGIESSESDWDFGRVRGFAMHGGSHNRAMGYYTDRDHPFYTWLFESFASSDRYFCARLGFTGLNRNYLYMGRDVAPSDPLPRTVLDNLEAAGVHWVNYGTAGNSRVMSAWNAAHRRPLSELHAILTGEPGAATLPPVAFARPVASEHPGAAPGSDLHQGEQLVRQIIVELMQSPYWSNTVVIVNYDEGGGFADHVAPPLACAPGAVGFERMGFRTPVYVVSPWARRDRHDAARGYLSHRAHDHTSVLHFLEARFDLPALTRRDANADALLDMFDFDQTPRPAPSPSSVPAGHAVDPRCPHPTPR